MRKRMGEAGAVKWGTAKLLVFGLLACLLGSSLFGQVEEEALDEGMAAAAEAALDRVALDVDQRGVAKRPETRGVQVRRRSNLGTADPIVRSGVAYYDEWTIRSGALKLRVPAYHGWAGVKPSSEFYALQAGGGLPGEHLALAIMNSGFVRSTRSKYVNEFGLVWVPQEHAFTSMTEASFAEFKESFRERIVEGRQADVEREDFASFENFLAFKEGRDEAVEEFIDGYLLRVVDDVDLVMYFATSEFIYQTSRQEIRQPMVMTVTYALVRGKLLRFDFKRLYLNDEDVVQLVAFTSRFVDDMRVVNGLSERKLR